MSTPEQTPDAKRANWLHRFVRLSRYLYQKARTGYWTWRLKQRLRKRGFEWLDASLKRQGYAREDMPDGTTIYRLGDVTWTVTLDA